MAGGLGNACGAGNAASQRSDLSNIRELAVLGVNPTANPNRKQQL